MMGEYYEFDHLRFDEAKARLALDRLLDEPSLGGVWTIHARNETAGYFVLALGFSLEFHGRDAFLDELYLRAPFRGRGIGGAAIRFAEEACRSFGVVALHLEVERANVNALEVYRRSGFVDHDRYLMTKLIAPRGGP